MLKENDRMGAKIGWCRFRNQRGTALARHDHAVCQTFPIRTTAAFDRIAHGQGPSSLRDLKRTESLFPRSDLPQLSERSTLVPTVLLGNAVRDALSPLLPLEVRGGRTTRNVLDGISAQSVERGILFATRGKTAVKWRRIV